MKGFFCSQAEGWPRENMTEDEKQEYIDEFWRINKVRLMAELISKNPVKRSIAKSILNSLWGKFGVYID
jgi:DNA polymerase type B, organellar and viral